MTRSLTEAPDVFARPPSPDARTAVALVRAFFKWHVQRFDALDKPHEPIADPVGWTRGGEFWVPPETWRDIIFEDDEDAALIAAQALRDTGLLRTQTGPSLQCNVKIRGEVRRCYCVTEKILAWTPSRGSVGYTPAQVPLPCGQEKGSTPLPLGDNLANKLEAATSLALDEALGILRMEAQLDDRAFQTILRAKAGIINTVLNTQVRVDEVQLQQHRRDEALPALLARIEAALKRE
jgi:hypothetical protein